MIQAMKKKNIRTIPTHRWSLVQSFLQGWIAFLFGTTLL
jgi:hypothetical protein